MFFTRSTVRKDPELRKRKPVIVHINYHPDKLPRMKATVEFYVNGKDDALGPFPDGTKRTRFFFFWCYNVTFMLLTTCNSCCTLE